MPVRDIHPVKDHRPRVVVRSVRSLVTWANEIRVVLYKAIFQKLGFCGQISGTGVCSIVQRQSDRTPIQYEPRCCDIEEFYVQSITHTRNE